MTGLVTRVALLLGLAVGAGLVLLAGCGGLGAQQQAPAPTVIVNTPPSDGGQTVLLTVALGVMVLALVAGGVLAWCWANERRTRRDVERHLRDTEYALQAARDTVLGLTGRPLREVRQALAGARTVDGLSVLSARERIENQ